MLKPLNHALLTLPFVALAMVMVPGQALFAQGRGLDLPKTTNKDGHAIYITEYEATTSADLLKKSETEHEVSFECLLSPGKEVDEVLCFASEVQAVSALSDDGKELIIRDRKPSSSRKQKFSSVQALPEIGMISRDQPMMLAVAEMDDIKLSRPGYEIDQLVVEVDTVKVLERKTVRLDAAVEDRFIDVGYGIRVRITKMEVRKGVMDIELDLQRAGGDRGAVIDEATALDGSGKSMGGGRWVNELDLFADKYDVELEIQLNGAATVDQIQFTLATEHETVRSRFEIETLFQK